MVLAPTLVGACDNAIPRHLDRLLAERAAARCPEIVGTPAPGLPDAPSVCACVGRRYSESYTALSLLAFVRHPDHPETLRVARDAVATCQRELMPGR